MFFKFIYFHINRPLAFGSTNDGGKIQKFLKNKQLDKFNFWIMYALLKFNKGKSDWNDIENNIYEFLNGSKTNADIETLISCFNHYSNVSYGERNNLPFSKYEEAVKFIHGSNLIVYSIQYDEKFKKIYESFSTHKISEEDLHNELILYTRDQLSNFEKDFNDYMFRISKDDNYNHNSPKVLEFLCSENPYKLLNFNYTSPRSNHQESYNNIHGKIINPQESSCKDKSIIIGINGKDIPMDSISYQFTKTFRITMMGNERHEGIIDDKLNEIIFFGHSLSVADYSYFKTIFDYNDLINSNLILTFYYSEYDGLSDYKLKTDMLIKISKLLNMYAGDKEGEVESGDQLLNLLVLNDRIKIKKLDIKSIIG